MKTVSCLGVVGALILILGGCAGSGSRIPTTGSLQHEPPDPPASIDQSTDDSGGDSDDYEAFIAEFVRTNTGKAFEACAQNEEPAPESKWLLTYDSFWACYVDMGLKSVDEVDAMSPPPGLSTAHDELVSSIRGLYEALAVEVSGFTRIEEHDAMVERLFIGAALWGQFSDISAKCRALEATAVAQGLGYDLDCPNSGPEPKHVVIEFDGRWSATPTRITDHSAPAIVIEISNFSDQPVIPIVLDIVESGDPLNLPVADGVIDLSWNGVVDPATNHTPFAVAYAGGVKFSNSGFDGTPAELGPGETVIVNAYSALAIVVLDYRTGEFVSGSYVVIDRS